MKNYAMVLTGNVIEVIKTDDNIIPKFPPNQHGYPVTAIECDDTVKKGMQFDEKTHLFYEDSGVDDDLSQLDRIEKTLLQENPKSTEIIMQAMTDAELRDFEIQQGQEMLAQQMADIELAVLGGGTTV